MERIGGRFSVSDLNYNAMSRSLSAKRSAFEVAWQTSGQVDDAVGQDLVNFLDHVA